MEHQRQQDLAVARRGLMLVLSSPSGAGKTTLSRKLLDEDNNVMLSVSVTTRKMRPGEKNGRDYDFIDRKRFDAMVDNDELLEWAEVFDNYYGTPKKPVIDALAAGRDVLFDIDWQGTRWRLFSRPNGLSANANPVFPILCVVFRRSSK